MELDPREIHVWFARLDDADPRCDEVLSQEERARAAKFRFAQSQREFRVSHALVRMCLSAYAPGIAAKDWTFVVGEHGRPDIAPVHRLPRLSFNLSHTTGLAACAVALDGPVGVDVEWAERKSATAEIAERFFAESEVAELRALPKARQKPRFFDYWTLKESFIKAHGKGLAIPLGKFAFTIPKDGAPSVLTDPSLGDDPKRWQFALWTPTPKHRAAVTVAGRRRRIVAFEAVPPVSVEQSEDMTPD